MSTTENANPGGAATGSGCGCSSPAMAAQPGKTAKAGCCGGGMTIGHDGQQSGSKAAVRDPVCGMTVDPATSQAPVRLSRRNLSFLLGRLPNQIRRRSEDISRQARAESRRAGGHDLHLPDASADPPGRSRKLPDLRHGAGARGGQPGCAAQSRTRRHDAALLDRPGAFRYRRLSWKWAATWSAVTAGSTRPCRTGFSWCSRPPSCSGRAGRSSCAAGNRC